MVLYANISAISCRSIKHISKDMIYITKFEDTKRLIRILKSEKKIIKYHDISDRQYR